MWVLVALTLFTNQGSVTAHFVRAYEEESDCRDTVKALLNGQGPRDHDEVYVCVPARKD